MTDGGSGSSPLVGRDRELATLAGALRRLAGGHGGIVWIHGEPGIGKTRLLDELGTRADAHGHLVLGGRGTEFEQHIPYGVWVDALDDYAGSLRPDRLERLSGGRLAELAGVLPAVEAPAAGDGAPALADERYRCHRAVRGLLEGLAGIRPVVLALDDVQWADSASVELLSHLVRRPPRGPVLLAYALRTGQAPDDLVAALEAATREGTAAALAPGPLSGEDAAALMGGRVDEEVVRESGGNPFYLVELARASGGAATEGGGRGGPADLPLAVAVALGREVAALGPEARTLVVGAAVVGEPIDLDLATEAAGMSPEPALDGLDELVSCGLLHATSVPRRYRFRHPIVRHAVASSLGERERLDAHTRAAAALGRRAGALTARAHHLERCARPGDTEAIDVLVAAAQETQVRAPASGARWLRAALDRLPADAAGEARRLELLAPLAVAEAAAGDLAAALRTLEDALARLPVELTAVRSRLVAACAATENLLGSHDAAHARLVRAHAELGELDPDAAVVIETELAADALYHGDYPAMVEWAGCAERSAGGDPARVATAQALECFARWSLGDTAAAARAGTAAGLALDGRADDEVAAHLAAPYYLGFAQYFCERYDDSARQLERGVRLARATNQGQYLVPMMIGLAHAYVMRGDLADGVDTADRAVDAARLTANPQMLSWGLMAQAWTAATAGETERARAAGVEAVGLLDGLDESILTRATRVYVAATWLELGDPERCLAEQRAGAADFALPEPGRRAWLEAHLARAELLCGRAGRAERYVASAEWAVDGLDLPMTEACVAHARAELELAEDEPAAAARRAAHACARAEAAGAAIVAARSRTLAGRALAASGDRRGAHAELTRAEATLAACGAMRLRDEAARELRRLGRRAPARSRGPAHGGVDGLSPRENEIALLVAEGHSNREIAGRLFVAPKTVENHLGNVFSKLGVRSRAELAARVATQAARADSAP